MRPASCDDLLEVMLGSDIVQRLNVINTNGVHFNPVSGNQELLALNCGEHKPQTRCSTESNRSEARALVTSNT
jgi:hypothetical protein